MGEEGPAPGVEPALKGLLGRPRAGAWFPAAPGARSSCRPLVSSSPVWSRGRVRLPRAAQGPGREMEKQTGHCEASAR